MGKKSKGKTYGTWKSQIWERSTFVISQLIKVLDFCQHPLWLPAPGNHFFVSKTVMYPHFRSSWGSLGPKTHSAVRILRWNSWTWIWQKIQVFCSMLFTVSSDGGFYRKPYSTLVLKLHTKKSAKQKTWVYSWKAFQASKIRFVYRYLFRLSLSSCRSVIEDWQEA